MTWFAQRMTFLNHLAANDLVRHVTSLKQLIFASPKSTKCGVPPINTSQKPSRGSVGYMKAPA